MEIFSSFLLPSDDGEQELEQLGAPLRGHGCAQAQLCNCDDDHDHGDDGGDDDNDDHDHDDDGGDDDNDDRLYED